MNDTQNIAIVYSAHGKKYTKYAERCARYSKKIICDQKCDLVFHTNHDYDNSEGIFDKVVYEKNNLKFDKILDYLRKNNIDILDIITEDGDLEDVFVQLTNH